MRTRLLALVLLLVVPAFLLALIGNYRRAHSEKRLSRERVMTMAKLAAAHEGYYIRQSRHELATMTQFPFAMMQDRVVTERGLKSLKRMLPDFDDFGLIETNGSVFCHTFGSNITRVVDPLLFQKVASVREFSASVFHRDTNAPTLSLQFAYPVLGTNGELKRVMYASLKGHLFSDVLTNIAMPEGGVITAFDIEGNIFGRWPNPQQWVGKQLPSSALIQTSLKEREGVFETTGLDGEERLYAVSPIGDGSKPAFFVTVGLPRRELFAQANQEFLVDLAIALLTLAFLLGVAWWYSSRVFLRPVAALVNAAERISEGDLTARTGFGGRATELHRLALGFDQMAAKLEKRQSELEQANLEIKRQNLSLESRVAERTGELQALNKELEAFSYSVSHDLRAPLRHMDGFAQMLLRDQKLQEDPRTKQRLETIKDAAKHMGALIDDLLSFSRMGRQSLTFTKVDFDQMVGAVVTSVSAEEKERSIDWKIHPLHEAYGDVSLLRQVWINLISNAVKYTHGKNPAVIEIESKEINGEVIYSVTDNGAGFDMAYADKLFGVFQRLHQESEFEGTGIGLANVRRVINRHGGRTWAEGKVGEGAIFSFSLPRISRKPSPLPSHGNRFSSAH